jgi:hypothetical protein
MLNPMKDTATSPVIEGFTRELAALRIAGQSAHGLITVRREADRRIHVDVEPGTLAELGTGTVIADEIRSAITAALGQFQDAYFDARWTWFGDRTGDERYAGAQTGRRR